MNEPMQAPRRDLPEEYREVSVVHIKDPTVIGDSMEVLNMDVINLDMEDFEYRQVTVPLEECCLIYQWSNAALRTRTHVHKDFDACFILGPQARGSIDGTELHPYALIAAGPGAQGEVVIDSNYENIVWLVSPQVLAKHLALRGKKGAFVIPANQSRHRVIKQYPACPL